MAFPNIIKMAGEFFRLDRGRYKQKKNVGSKSQKKSGGQLFRQHLQDIKDAGKWY